jgi:hypothetical protein
MAKWADYCVFAVRYDAERSHIVNVKGYPDLGYKLGTPSEMKQTEVVNSIEHGNSFITIFTNPEGDWKKGEDIRIVAAGGGKYLRTDSGSKAADDLGNLMEF